MRPAIKRHRRRVPERALATTRLPQLSEMLSASGKPSFSEDRCSLLLNRDLGFKCSSVLYSGLFCSKIFPDHFCDLSLSIIYF